MRSKIFYLIILLLSLTFAPKSYGQTILGDPKGAQPPPRPIDTKPPDTGRLDGARYVNDFFGFFVEVPQDWVLMDAFTRGDIKRRAKEIIGTEGSEKQEQINASIERTTILFGVSKFPPGSTQPFNASFSLIAERVPSAVMRNGADVLRAMQRTFRDARLDVEFQDGIRETKMGGADFAVATARVNIPAGSFMQRHYITVRKSFALQFTYTYLDESDLATFDEIMRTVKFQ